MNLIKSLIKREAKMTNETLEVLKSRRSCRSFKSDMIKDEELDAILKAGTYAASAKGKQSSIIIVVKNKELREKLSKENAKIGNYPDGVDPFYGAPVILIVLADKDANGSLDTHRCDGSLVLGNLMNAAESLGVASIWINRAREEFDSEFGKNILKDLGIKGNYEGIGHCALGYAKDVQKAAAPRKKDYIYRID